MSKRKKNLRSLLKNLRNLQTLKCLAHRSLKCQGQLCTLMVILPLPLFGAMTRARCSRLPLQSQSLRMSNRRRKRRRPKRIETSPKRRKFTGIVRTAQWHFLTTHNHTILSEHSAHQKSFTRCEPQWQSTDAFCCIM